MDPITLKTETEENIPLEAAFLPEKGMTLASYKLGGQEVIDQSTRSEFEKRRAGLGPLIGPHFHVRNPATIPPLPDPEKFPPAAGNLAAGEKDPFVHGLGRYAPWSAEQEGNSIKAVLKGSDSWNGVPLKELEGQDFEMRVEASLEPGGLTLDLSVVSEADSIVGIHYYYALPQNKGVVMSTVKDAYIINNEKKPLPKDWNYSDSGLLTYPLNQATDFTFFPKENPLQGKIILDAVDYTLTTTYFCQSEENSFQLWHPQGASFVCIEPVSSQNPRRANLTVSGIKIHLHINAKPQSDPSQRL